MPSIKAIYKEGKDEFTVMGYNAGDRNIFDSAPPSEAIKRYAAPLGQFMDSLHNEGTRSAYACAEAEALAKLLTLAPATIDFSEIRFSCPISDVYLLWEPCRNCSAWLTADGGFAARRVYKLSDNIINLLNPVKIQKGFDTTDEKQFPKLGK